MKNKVILAFLLSTWTLFGCNVIFNPIANKMLVRQGIQIIAHKTGVYDFGSVSVGFSSDAIEFRIENHTKDTLFLTASPMVQFSGLNASDFKADTSSTNNVIHAYLFTIFKITFSPSSIGAKSATVTIANSITSQNPYIFTVKGTGLAVVYKPEINVKQGTTNIACTSGIFDFGSVNNGMSSPTVEWTIENLGNVDLNLTGNPFKVVSSSGDNFMFVVDAAATNSPVSAGFSTTFTVTFKPTSEGSKTSTIVIPNNDADENPYVFTVKGFGAPYTWAPEINVKQGSTNIPSATGIYNFGSFLVGSSSNAITFTIENLGNANLNLTGNPSKIVKTGGEAAMFTVNQSATVSPVQAGSSTTFTVTFLPTSEGNKSTTIAIPNNDSNENPYIFTVTGTCIIDPEINVKQGTINIPCTTGTYDFGSIFTGNSTSAKTFTIENLGTTELILNGTPKVQVSGADSAMFTINQTATTSPIAPSSNTAFTLTFSPTSAGNKSATISIPNNDSDENPYTFSVTGTGLVGPEINIKQGSTNIACTTGSYNFGSVRVNNSSSAITFTIENLGNQDLLLTGSPKIQISGTDAAMFSINQTATTSPVTAGNSTTFSITFTPTSDGNKSATISIPNNDADENPYTFGLIGAGTTSMYCWTRQIGSSGSDSGKSITTDTLGNIYLTGNFNGTVDFGADFSVSDSKTSAGSGDVFITKINANGTYGWTRRMGGSDGMGDTGGSITTDTSGNVYVAGWFSGTVNFGTDFSVNDNKTSAGEYDAFITKINSNGTYGWTKRFGGTSVDYGNSITTDVSGNIYLTGSFQGAVNFGEDFSISDNKTSAGLTEIYITKINANGTYGWTKQMGGSSSDKGYSITTDISGNIYLTGTFQGTVDFGADFGVSDSKTSSGNSDIFTTKINSNGTYGWTKRIGGTNTDYGNSITTDLSGNIYITGYFWGTVNFGADFSISDSKTVSGSCDIFITKINANGTYGWTKRMGGTGGDYGNSITTDSSGNIFLTGYFWGTVDFGADFSVSDSKTSVGSWEIFITKVNANGTYGWTKRMGGTSEDYGNSITVDSSGNIYLTGYFNGTVDFGTDFSVSDSKTSAGNNDIFITKLTP